MTCKDVKNRIGRFSPTSSHYKEDEKENVSQENFDFYIMGVNSARIKFKYLIEKSNVQGQGKSPILFEPWLL